jgi:hypothetical protein
MCFSLNIDFSILGELFCNIPYCILQSPLIISYHINVRSHPLDNMDVTIFICLYKYMQL